MEPHTIPQADGQLHELSNADTPVAAAGPYVPTPADPYAAQPQAFAEGQDPYAQPAYDPHTHYDPAAYTPAAEQPAQPEQPAYDQQAYEQAAYEQPAPAEPAYEQAYAPAPEAPVYEEQPAYEQAAPQQPTYEEQPAYEQAAPAQPAYEQAAPAYEQSVDPGAYGSPVDPAAYTQTDPAAFPAASEPVVAQHANFEEDFNDEGISKSQGRCRHCRSDVEAALELGFVTHDQVAAAQAAAQEQGRGVEEMLVDLGSISPEHLAKCVSERHGIDLVDLSTFKVDFTASNLIDPAAAKRYESLPIARVDDRTLMVAMVDPANIIVLDDVSLMTGLDVVPMIASREDLAGAISRLTRLDDVVADSDSTGDDREEDDGVVDLRGGSDDAPVIKLVNQVIAQAVERGASDIHLQAGEFEMRVRYRVDGVLVDALDVPRRMAAGVVSRIKIMATLDIAERRIPQDGRISLTIDGHKLDLRVVTLPSVHGEAVIMRILDKGSVVMDLDILGMRQEERERFELGFHQAYGAVLVTGPTGSGKSTTLYAALGAINTPEKNIITIEDPVEYQLAGVNQVQVNPKAGLSFAQGLRALMRADPDVIMVGEIRDKETAQIAIESALTGHLVLSTLHTNDAPSAVSRLMEMGIEPFLIASSIETVVAQRLSRRLCKHCKQETELSVEVLRVNGFDRDEPLKAFEPKGCSRCSNSGYKGRLGLYEVMSAGDELRDLITARATADEIGEVARKNGMRTLRDDGIAKVEMGMTSIQEVARVCGTT